MPEPFSLWSIVTLAPIFAVKLFCSRKVSLSIVFTLVTLGSSWLSLTESYKPIYIDELGYDPGVIEKILGNGGNVVFRGTSLNDLLNNVFKKWKL